MSDIILSLDGDIRPLESKVNAFANKPIKLNLKNSLSQPLGRITGDVSEFNKSLEASNARVLAFGASAGAIYSIQKALGETVKSAIEVEKALTDINVILNVSTKTLNEFGGSLFSIAKNTGQSFDQVSKAAVELARQGLSVEQTLQRTSDALILSRLSGLDAARSVETLTATLNSFSQAGLTSTEIINKLANVDAAFAVSSGDLAEAISRVGSTAQDVGVNLDELIALVTAAQQTTARGGSVIGNSFKTIFTRLQRGKTLDELENAGIAVRDLQGNALPAVTILNNLAQSFDTLSKSQQAAIAETVGGVYQINILRATLGDLSKQYSIYNSALNISATSTNQAISRNEALNKTLSALVNETFVNLKQAAAEVGNLVFAPAIKTSLGGLNAILGDFNKPAESQGIGTQIAKSLLSGIGAYLGGPGLLVLGTVFVRLFAGLTKFSGDALKTLLGITSQADKIAAAQQRVNGILAQNPQLIDAIISKEMSLLTVEEKILGIIQQQNSARAVAQTISGRVAPQAATVPIPKVKVGKAGGYIPNFVDQMMEDIGAAQHGYTAGTAYKTRLHDGTGGSFISTVNSAETVKTFTNGNGKKATMVVPPNGFARGYVPNFAVFNPNKHIQRGGFVGRSNKSTAEGLSNLTSLMGINYSGPITKQNLTQLFSSKENKKKLYQFLKKEPILIKQYPELYSEVKDGNHRFELAQLAGIKNIPAEYLAKGFIPNFADKKEIDLNQLDSSLASKFGIILGAGGEGKVPYSQTAYSIPLIKGLVKDPSNTRIKATLPTKSIFPLKGGNVDQAEAQFTNELDQSIGPGLIDFATKIGKQIYGAGNYQGTPAPYTQYLGEDTKGLIFENAVKSALTPEHLSDKPSQNFDFDPASAYPALTALLGYTNPEALEAKISEKAAGGGDIPKKILNQRGLGSALVSKVISMANSGSQSAAPVKGKKGKASGYIPNFAALQDAVSREKNAGIPSSLIRVGSNSNLVSSSNPNGIGVYNTRDEPGGLGQGVSRASKGYVPNFATATVTINQDAAAKAASDAANRLMLIANIAPLVSTTLTSFGKTTEKTSTIINSLTTAISLISTAVTLGAGPIGITIAAIAALGVAVYQIGGVMGDVTEKLKAESDKLADTLTNINGVISEAGPIIEDFIQAQKDGTEFDKKSQDQLASVLGKLPDDLKNQIVGASGDPKALKEALTKAQIEASSKSQAKSAALSIAQREKDSRGMAGSLAAIFKGIGLEGVAKSLEQYKPESYGTKKEAQLGAGDLLAPILSKIQGADEFKQLTDALSATQGNAKGTFDVLQQFYTQLGLDTEAITILNDSLDPASISAGNLSTALIDMSAQALKGKQSLEQIKKKFGEMGQTNKFAGAGQLFGGEEAFRDLSKRYDLESRLYAGGGLRAQGKEKGDVDKTARGAYEVLKVFQEGMGMDLGNIQKTDQYKEVVAGREMQMKDFMESALASGQFTGEAKKQIEANLNPETLKGLAMKSVDEWFSASPEQKIYNLFKSDLSKIIDGVAKTPKDMAKDIQTEKGFVGPTLPNMASQYTEEDKTGTRGFYGNVGGKLGTQVYDKSYEAGEMLVEGAMNFKEGLTRFLTDGLSMMQQGAKNIGTSTGIIYGPQSQAGVGGVSEENLGNTNTNVNIGGAINVVSSPDQSTQNTILGLKAAQQQIDERIQKIENSQGGIPKPPQKIAGAGAPVEG